jgi:hypothetical protein
MIRYSKHVAKLSAIAAAVLAGPTFAAMTTDANLELDSDYRTRINSTPDTNNRDGGVSQGGRVEFNIAGKAGDANGFVAARGTLLLKKDGTAATDDMWGQIGTGMADVKLGRFEATDMFPPGKDVLVEDGATAAGGYRTNVLRGRKGSTDFHAALTVNPGSGLSFELGLIETGRKLDPTLLGDLPDGWPYGAVKGIRPVVSFAAGPVTVKAAFETGSHLDTRAVAGPPAIPGLSGPKFTGFGVTVGGSLEGVAFNVNLGTGKVKSNSALAAVIGANDIKSTSFGANATFGPAGVGLIMDTDKIGSVKSKDTVIYAAYSIPLFSTGAELTPAISHQTGKVGSTSLDSATAVRVRLNYKF